MLYGAMRAHKHAITIPSKGRWPMVEQLNCKTTAKLSFVA